MLGHEVARISRKKAESFLHTGPTELLFSLTGLQSMTCPVVAAMAVPRVSRKSGERLFVPAQR
jgi:hypothetical protein